MLFWAPSSPRMANMQHWCKLSRTGRDTPACVFPRWQSSTIFVILQFWTTHEVALMGCMLQDNGVTIRSDVTNRLLFYIFGNLAGKYIFVPLLRQFLAHNGRRGGPMLNPKELFLTFWVFNLHTTFRENRSRNATVGVRTDKRTDRLMHAK